MNMCIANVTRCTAAHLKDGRDAAVWETVWKEDGCIQRKANIREDEGLQFPEFFGVLLKYFRY